MLCVMRRALTPLVCFRHADGARVSVRFKRLSDIHRTATAVITIDRKWFPMQASAVRGE